MSQDACNHKQQGLSARRRQGVNEAEGDEEECIRENPNSTFPLITEIFGEITLNFHGLSQITALSKLPQITRS